VRYLIVAEAYRDLERVSSRLALTQRLAAGLAMRFPRFTGRWRDDKAPEDATTTRELAELFLAARRTPADG
jgi:ATP-dependent DNA ligase